MKKLSNTEAELKKKVAYKKKTCMPYMHCIKYRYFTQFPGVGILWKVTVATEFQVNRQNSTEIVRVHKISTSGN